MSVLKLRQRGDTIVEVMIAITVASSVLGVSLSTMNRNLAITQINQERTAASKVAQGQLEALKAADLSKLPVMPSVGTAFCYSDNGASILNRRSLSASQVMNFTSSLDVCQKSFYSYSIVRSATNSYSIYVRWDSTKGTKESVTMAYRL